MNSETRSCQNCKNDFIIESDDFGFYEKIKVPPPTFCPECRLKRRTAWRNDWHLFKKKDSHTGETIFSLFPEESPVKIYDRDYWWGDDWDPTEYGKGYDFSRPFFEQFKELLDEVPIPSTSMTFVVNCHYCTNANNIKNCYFSRGITYTEDSAYLIWDQASKNCFDSHMTNGCELSYGNVNTINCYKTLFSVDCESCQETILCKDCVGCNSCFGSAGLRNKSYCIFNQQYSREEYLKKVAEFELDSSKKFEEIKKNVYQHWLKYPQKFMRGRQNVQVTGDYIYESKNAKNCYRIRDTENSRFVSNVLSGPVKDCYDYTNWGENAELVYESLIVGLGAYNIKFSLQSWNDVKNLTYCVFCHNSSNLFGCVSLRNKSYCIFNKQYTKEEYEILVPKIIEHMNNMPYIENGIVYKYGEYFPSSLSHFPYQITQAQEFFPLNKKDAKNQGFLWYEVAKPNYQVTLKKENIPDSIKNIDKSILNEVIECTHGGSCGHECTGAFRVIKTELNFLKRMNIFLPRLCPNCRHYERLSLRNSFGLYNRVCMCEKKYSNHEGKCSIEFETSYSPDRPEIVFCEKCYQQEVY
ncbi:hypothetical protein HYZ82_00650 [Candidatus Nomurabacteria bacterium]|nr:hypothetical protein [Candidatus Nomurabacteria bacterium]